MKTIFFWGGGIPWDWMAVFICDKQLPPVSGFLTRKKKC